MYNRPIGFLVLAEVLAAATDRADAVVRANLIHLNPFFKFSISNFFFTYLKYHILKKAQLQKTRVSVLGH